MGIGPTITLVVFVCFAVGIFFLIKKERRIAREAALSKKHGPHLGTPEINRAKHINKGGLGSSGNIGSS